MECPSFINIDIEMTSKENLEPFIMELGTSVSVLHKNFRKGFHEVNFECVDHKNGRILDRLIELLSKLSESGRNLLDGCETRYIDIGYSSGEVGWLYDEIPAPLLGKIAGFGFGLKVSLYGVNPAANC